MWRRRVGIGLSVLIAAMVVGAAASGAGAGAQRLSHGTIVSWDDIPAALRPLLEARDLSRDSFPAFITGTRSTTAQRVREGQLDHVIYYALQSTHFTKLPPIEPALSAKALADSLDAETGARFRADPLSVSLSSIPRPVEQRFSALLTAFDDRKRSEDDVRLRLFGGVVEAAFPDRQERRAGLLHAYVRAMRFLYEKEFEARAPGATSAATSAVAAGEAPGSAASPTAAATTATTAATATAATAATAAADKADVTRLYRTRGLSTDTAVEAGFLMHLGLATVHALDASYRVHRALIVGPGLDLAPRTGLLEAAPPQSYQPWALADSLVSLGLSRLDDLQVTAADINPLVVDHVTAVSHAPPALVLLSGIPNDSRIALSDDYRDYFARFGRAIGVDAPPPQVDRAHAAHLRKTVQITAVAAHTLRAEPLDIVTERLPERFDLVIITNVLPYLDDRELMLALANITAMLEPGGVLLHNEPRPLVGEATTRIGLPLVHARNAIIATVTGAPAPLADMVFIHRRAQPEAKN